MSNDVDLIWTIDDEEYRYASMWVDDQVMDVIKWRVVWGPEPLVALFCSGPELSGKSLELLVYKYPPVDVKQFGKPVYRFENLVLHGRFSDDVDECIVYRCNIVNLLGAENELTRG